jgi:hypothetical protein
MTHHTRSRCEAPFQKLPELQKRGGTPGSLCKPGPCIYLQQVPRVGSAPLMYKRLMRGASPMRFRYHSYDKLGGVGGPVFSHHNFPNAFLLPDMKRFPLLLHYLPIGTLEPGASLLRGERSPTPRTLGRVFAHLTTRRRALPSRYWREWFPGGFVATQASTRDQAASRPSSIPPKGSAKSWNPPAPLITKPGSSPRESQDSNRHSSAQPFYVSAHSLRFVASPGQSRKLQSLLPAAIREALPCTFGFAGCMVMISDHEARLVTVVTLWTGQERVRDCTENVAEVKKLLSSYVDHWLRSETHVAHFFMLSQIERNFQECCFPGGSTT